MNPPTITLWDVIRTTAEVLGAFAACAFVGLARWKYRQDAPLRRAREAMIAEQVRNEPHPTAEQLGLSLGRSLRRLIRRR